jgi:hypothetical protein
MVGPMTATEALTEEAKSRVFPPCVEIVVPVYNEERTLATSVRRLRAYLDQSFPFTSVVTVVDNGSTDGTSVVAAGLAAELDGSAGRPPDRQGPGRALRAVWSTSPAQVVAYMDVDLSTSLDALLPSGGAAALGSQRRGHRDPAGPRCPRRAGTEAGVHLPVYNLLLKAFLGNGFSDAQCGFKAARTEVARALLPLVEDNEWFFDTELLVLAERSGFRIHEVPVDWVDDPDSRVDILRTARDDLLGLIRLCLRPGSFRPPTPLRSSRLGGRVRPGRRGQHHRLSHCVLLAVGDARPVRCQHPGAGGVHGGQHRPARRYTFARRGEPSWRNILLGGMAALSSGRWATRAGPTPSMRRPCRPGPRAGRLLLRLDRLLELHHRRQAAGVPVGDGDLGRIFGSTPGASSCPRRSRAWPPWAALRHRPALVPPGRRAAAGAILALTPVAALMFRYNNPDALLVLLLTSLAAYAWCGRSSGPAPGGWCWPPRPSGSPS